jgi:hypothetical protein
MRYAATRRGIMPTAQDVERHRQNWQDEIDSDARLGVATG